jgi:hypothetical protein
MLRARRQPDALQGTLPQHGYGIATHIGSVSGEALRVEEGALYPALHRMERAGWIKARHFNAVVLSQAIRLRWSRIRTEMAPTSCCSLRDQG